MTDQPSSSRRDRTLARLLPWVLAAVLVALLLYRVDARSVLHHLGRVSLPRYLLLVALSTPACLLCDVFAAHRVYRRAAPRLTLGALLIARGAASLPAALNFHLGQLYLTFLLTRRHGVTPAAATGHTLLSYATFFGCVVAVAALAAPFGGAQAPVLVHVVLGFVGAGLLYLGVLALRPRLLSERAVLAPLFRAGVAGNLRLLLLRLPHVACLICVLTLAYACFGVQLPLAQAVFYMPALILVSALPLTPQGIGVREFAALPLLAPYALGHDAEAAVVAAGAAWSAASVVSQCVVGLCFWGLRPSAVRASLRPAKITP